MDDLAVNVRNFLQFLVLNFIEDTDQARLKLLKDEEQKQISFRLVLSERDVAKMIGKNGFTASSIRSFINAAGEKAGINVVLKINSTSEEEERLAALEQ